MNRPLPNLQELRETGDLQSRIQELERQNQMLMARISQLQQQLIEMQMPKRTETTTQLLVERNNR